MRKALAFDDVLIRPCFSKVKSRKDVDLSSMGLSLPVIASNMDTISGPEMAQAMAKSGGVATLHRFWSIEENVEAFRKSKVNPWVSVGLGDKELERADALIDAGANTIVLDVAHGANVEVVKHVLQDIEGGLRSALSYVGASNIEEFQKKAEFIEITSAGMEESRAHGVSS